MNVKNDLSYTERLHMLEALKIYKSVKKELMGPSDITAVETLESKIKLANKTEIIMSNITRRTV